MISRFLFVTVISFSLVFFSCSREQRKDNIESYFTEQADSSITSKVAYAKGFDVYYWEGITKLVIYHPELNQVVIGEYYLAEKDITERFRDTSNLITIPVDSVALFSATQLNAFDKLGLLDKIVGVSESKYITNEVVKKKISDGSIIELAGSGNFYIEKTLTVGPSIVFYSPYKVTETHPLEITKIPLIPFYDYFETDPIGRAEWIKFTALFFGMEKEADSIFNEIVTAYQYYRELAGQTSTRPTVFSDKYFNGQWFIPGGQSYIARLFADAGADYLWSSDPHSASFPLDYEVVFGKAYNADFWRIVGSYGDTPTYSGLEAENGLYKHFNAFQKKQVIYCNARESAYFETGPLEPHIILADLIKAFHPEVLPDYEPKYYKILP